MAERTYQDECGDHGDHSCGLAAGWGTDFNSGKCKFHRGTSPDGKSHEGNEHAADHYAFSDKFRSDLTEAENKAVESLVGYLTEIDDERRVAAECAAEALMKYKRSGDVRFLREARQWMSDFNLLPNEDEINVGGDAAGILIDMTGDDE